MPQEVYNTMSSSPESVSEKLEKDPKTQASEEMEKDALKEDSKLKNLIAGSNRILLKVSTVFPFDFFPDDIIIDETKVTIIFRTFFWTERVHSIYVKDLSDVLVEVSPFFATLKLVDLGFKENSIDIPFLRKSQAIRARQIIQGLVISAKQGIDVTKYSADHLAQMMQEIGTSENVIGHRPSLQNV